MATAAKSLTGQEQLILPILTSAFSRSGQQSWTILVPKSRSGKPARANSDLRSSASPFLRFVFETLCQFPRLGLVGILGGLKCFGLCFLLFR